MKLYKVLIRVKDIKIKLRWEHIIIAFLLGAVWSPRGGDKVLHQASSNTRSPSFSIKLLPVIKQVPEQPQKSLDVVWVNKLRPYGAYNGSNYDPGQCTWGVASRLPIPSNWGNANNWSYAAALAGYQVSSTPKVGSVAQTGGDSWAGHVAIVESVNPDGSFMIWEMNGSGGSGSTDERPSSTSEFPNFIYI